MHMIVFATFDQKDTHMHICIAEIHYGLIGKIECYWLASLKIGQITRNWLKKG